MKYYTSTTEFNCGIDLHARQMYVCVMDRQGKKLVHSNVKDNDFDYFLKLVQPYRHDLTVCCECMFGSHAMSRIEPVAPMRMNNGLLNCWLNFDRPLLPGIRTTFRFGMSLMSASLRNFTASVREDLLEQHREFRRSLVRTSFWLYADHKGEGPKTEGS